MKLNNKMYLESLIGEEIVELITSKKNDFFTEYFSYFLFGAIQKHNDEIFDLLLKRCVQDNRVSVLNESFQNGLNPLSLCVMSHNIDYIKKLLSLGEVNPLESVSRNIAKMNKDLRQISAVLNSRHMTPLSIAVDLGYIDIIELFKPYVLKKELISQALYLSGSKNREAIISSLLNGCESEVKDFLFDLIEGNQFNQLSSLLQLKFLKHLDFTNERGMTPLICAVKNKSLDSLIVLSDALKENLIKMDVNYVTNETTALNEACLLNQEKFVKKLLFMGANPLRTLGVAISDDGLKQIKKTPFFNLVVQILKGKDTYSDVLFYLTCISSEVVLAQEAVKMAKFLNTSKIYKLLLKNSSNLSDMVVYAERLLRSVREGDVDFARFLVKRCVSPVFEVNGTTPLHEAAKLGKCDILNLFINDLSVKKLETNYKNVSPFLMAIWHKQEKAALMLLKAGVSIPENFSFGKSVLTMALEFDMASIVEAILAKKMRAGDIKLVQKVLWQAVALKKNKTVNALCNLDIDMGYKNIYGTDLLLLAVKKMNFQATSLFVQKGMNIDVFDENKMTPLHYAVLNKDEKSCFLLIENKAKVNVQNIYGQTPLMLAAERGLTKIAAVLIEHRADVLLKDGRGYRPFDYYCKYKAVLKKSTKLSERTRGE